MIKNVVFDFGNVLIGYDPYYMTSRYVENAEDARLISDVLFDRIYWDRLDSGTVTDSEVVRLASARLPQRLHAACEKVYYNWVHNLPAISGMWQLVSDIKRKYGVRLFLCSNISKYFVGFASEFSVLSEFEKCMYSAEVGHVKPDKDMFEYLLSTCNILASETLFIDDSPKNIRGAEQCGIAGYLFDGDAARLAEYLDCALVKA